MKRHFDEENDKLSPQIHNVAVNAKRKEPEKKQTNRPSKGIFFNTVAAMGLPWFLSFTLHF